MALPQEQRYTLADALEWEEGVRIELVDGVPVMQASPARRHQEISGELFAFLHDYLRGKKCKVYHAPFSVRPFETKEDTPDSVDTVVEPDITLVCDPDKLDDIGCKGAPDMIAEIISPSTQRHDRVTKFNLYQQAGVKEYWIVDPDTETVQVYLLEDGQYHAAQVYTKQSRVKVESLENCFIDLGQVFVE